MIASIHSFVTPATRLDREDNEERDDQNREESADRDDKGIEQVIIVYRI